MVQIDKNAWSQRLAGYPRIYSESAIIVGKMTHRLDPLFHNYSSSKYCGLVDRDTAQSELKNEAIPCLSWGPKPCYPTLTRQMEDCTLSWSFERDAWPIQGISLWWYFPTPLGNSASASGRRFLKKSKAASTEKCHQSDQDDLWMNCFERQTSGRHDYTFSAVFQYIKRMFTEKPILSQSFAWRERTFSKRNTYLVVFMHRQNQSRRHGENLWIWPPKKSSNPPINWNMKRKTKGLFNKFS